MFSATGSQSPTGPCTGRPFFMNLIHLVKNYTIFVGQFKAIYCFVFFSTEYAKYFEIIQLNVFKGSLALFFGYLRSLEVNGIRIAYFIAEPKVRNLNPIISLNSF